MLERHESILADEYVWRLVVAHVILSTCAQATRGGAAGILRSCLAQDIYDSTVLAR